MMKTKAIGIALIALTLLLAIVAIMTEHLVTSGVSLLLGTLIFGLELAVLSLAQKEKEEIAARKKAEEDKRPADD